LASKPYKSVLVEVSNIAACEIWFARAIFDNLCKKEKEKKVCKSYLRMNFVLYEKV
jgi:hypothetical protein